MSVVDELVTVLGFKVDDAQAKRFDATLHKIKRGAMAVGAAVAAASTAIGVLTKGASANIDETGKFARSMGINVEALQGFEFAAKHAGASADQMRSDIAGFTKSLASPIPGEYNDALLNLFHINPFEKGSRKLRDSTELLLEVADKLKGMSAQKALIMGGELGLSEGMIRVLRGGSESILKSTKTLRDMGGIVSEEDTKRGRSCKIH